MHDRLRDRLLTALARWSFRHRRLNLSVCAGLALVAIVFSVMTLGFQSDRNALISDRLDWNQRFLAWQQAFNPGGDLLIVVDAADSSGDVTERSRARAQAAMDALGAALQEHEETSSARWRLDTADLSPRLLRIAPEQEFAAGLAGLDAGLAFLGIRSLDEMLTVSMAGDAEEQGAIAATFFGLMLERFSKGAEESIDFARALGASLTGPPTYLATENGRLLLMPVRPARSNETVEPYEAAMRIIHEEIDRVRVSHPSVELGLTGIEAIESDETAAAVRDATLSSLVAAGLILLVLFLSYRGLAIPLTLAATLTVAMAWTFAFTSLAVGHLQVISVVFAAILLGLGADFGVHVIGSLARRLPKGITIGEGRYERAVISAYRTAGPGLVTGAVTTACAFGTTMLTDFTGVAEMGLIAGGGVLLAVVATLVMLPGLLWLCRHQLAGLSRSSTGRATQRINQRRPTTAWVVTGVGVLLLGGAGLLVSEKSRFDYDLLKLLPVGVESVTWQNRIVRDGERTVWYGVSIADSLEEARERVWAFRRHGTGNRFGDLSGIAMLFPPDEEQRMAALAERREQVLAVDPGVSLLAADDGEAFAQVDRLMNGLIAGATLAQLTGDARWAASLLERGDEWQRISQLGEADRDAGIAALRGDVGRWRSDVLSMLRAATDPDPLGVEELPDLLVATAVSEEQPARYAIEVYPRLPEGIDNPLDPEFLPAFIGDLRGVDPEATGVIVQVYESGRLIQRAYLFAGLVSFVLVLSVVAIDFWSLVYAVMAMVPVLVGMVLGAAALVLLDQPLTPASVIGLPLLFGVGVDSGVHLLHRYRLHPRVRWPGLTDGTGWSVALTGSLTLIGFASLLLASHRGMAGLGLVMTLGIGFTLLACFTAVPAILRLITPVRMRGK
ncbi:MAG: MMPL family transporter [Phycisphaeraceae bacterium]